MKCRSFIPMCALALLVSSGADQNAYGQGRGAEVFVAEFAALNGSGVSGRATLVKKGNRLLVKMVVKGYEPLRMHAQHIHGLVDTNGNPTGDSTCPPPQADVNNDGIITVQEGFPFYGPVRVPLLPFPTPMRGQGAVTYHQMFDLTQFPRLLSLDKHTIILHGLSKTGNPSIDNPLPVACAEIHRVQKHRR